MYAIVQLLHSFHSDALQSIEAVGCCSVVLFTSYSALMWSVVQTYRKLWFFNVSFNPRPLIRIHLNFSYSHKKTTSTTTTTPLPRLLFTFCKHTHKLPHCIQNHDRYRIINIHCYAHKIYNEWLAKFIIQSEI